MFSSSVPEIIGLYIISIVSSLGDGRIHFGAIDGSDSIRAERKEEETEEKRERTFGERS